MPNYDELESTASYHGTEIRTKVPTDALKSIVDHINQLEEQLKKEKDERKKLAIKAQIQAMKKPA